MEAEQRKKEEEDRKLLKKRERDIFAEYVYGKTKDLMAANSYRRARKWAHANDVKAPTKKRLPKSPGSLSFGSLPRAYFKGGGELDVEKTRSIQHRQPQEEPASRFLKHPPYGASQTTLLRQRNKAKELYGNFRFKASTEAERINEEIDKVRRLNIEVDDTRFSSFVKKERLKQKQEEAASWVGGRFSIVPPKKGRLLPVASMDVGTRWQRPISAVGKDRNISKELGSSDFTIFKRSERDIQEAKSRGTPIPKMKTYSKSTQELRVRAR